MRCGAARLFGTGSLSLRACTSLDDNVSLVLMPIRLSMWGLWQTNIGKVLQRERPGADR